MSCSSLHHVERSLPLTIRPYKLVGALLALAIFLVATPVAAFPEEEDCPGPSHPPPLGILRLTVVDALSGRPIPGAAVRVRQREIATDGRGQATLRLRPAVSVVHASVQGYLSASLVYVGEETAVLSLPPRSLTGVVRDAGDRHPLGGALVYDSQGRYVRTDSGGHFQFPDVNTDATLLIKAPGYRKESFRRGSRAIAYVDLHPFVAKGVYMPFGLFSNPQRVRAILDLVQQTELNTIVVDMKSDRGRLAYASAVPLAQQVGAPQTGPTDIVGLVREAHRRGIYIVARLVVFKDEPLAVAHPEWAARRADGTLWRDQENLGWANPFRQEVQEYNIAIAKEVAGLGFDEVQFDYVRFPSDGDIHNIVYEEENTADTRRAAIEAFMSRLEAELRPYAVFTSADVFGLVPWVDGEMGIGQQMENIAPYVDYLCPMVYPSTFAPWSMQFENPALHPYDVVFRSVVQARSRTDTLIRPWLQHYSLYGVTYGPDEYLAQRRATEAAGGIGWTYWNAGGKYASSIFTPITTP